MKVRNQQTVSSLSLPFPWLFSTVADPSSLTAPRSLPPPPQVQCALFSSTYNPAGIRAGNKVLRQRLRGPTLAAYYPRKSATLTDLKHAFSKHDLDITIPEEEDRLEGITFAKLRGKGAPKKKREKDSELILGKGAADTMLISPFFRQCQRKRKNDLCGDWRGFRSQMQVNRAALFWHYCAAHVQSGSRFLNILWIHFHSQLRWMMSLMPAACPTSFPFLSSISRISNLPIPIHFDVCACDRLSSASGEEIAPAVPVHQRFSALLDDSTGVLSKKHRGGDSTDLETTGRMFPTKFCQFS